MRFKTKRKTKPKYGETRIKSGFLLLPKNIDHEWRWLEHSKWEQTCIQMSTLMPDGHGHSPGHTHPEWINTKWS